MDSGQLPLAEDLCQPVGSNVRLERKDKKGPKAGKGGPRAVAFAALRIARTIQSMLSAALIVEFAARLDVWDVFPSF